MQLLPCDAAIIAGKQSGEALLTELRHHGVRQRGECALHRLQLEVGAERAGQVVRLAQLLPARQAANGRPSEPHGIINPAYDSLAA